MKLTIALPGLLWPDAGDIPHLARQLDTKNLDKVIKRSQIRQIPYSFSDLVYSTYTTTTGSLATEIAKNLGYAGLYPNFLLAEPTFLRADRHRLLICESEILQLNDNEISIIIDNLNDHFSGILQVFKVNANLWLVGLNLNINNNKFYPILDIIGENIDNYLPSNSIELTKLLNEIQMLLFNLELNRPRKNEGLIQINSLWLWDKQIKFNLINNYSNIFYNGQSLNSAKIKHLPKLLPDAFIDGSLIIFDNLYYPCCYRDHHSYLHNLSIIDNQVMTILLQYLNRFDTLEILIPGIHKTLVITLNKNDRYKFWKNLTFIQLIKGTKCALT
ncbi:MAG: hypothetical protein K0R94_851 [Burkholderiales bacterium]|jgi:hypothetical protein|nr:hypothetical protein [Burkholderiales bacterium]